MWENVISMTRMIMIARFIQLFRVDHIPDGAPGRRALRIQRYIFFN